HQLCIELRPTHLGSRHAERGLGLVNGAVRLDPEGVLANSPAVEEGGGAVIASFRRDAHRTAAYWPIVLPPDHRSAAERARPVPDAAPLRSLDSSRADQPPAIGPADETARTDRPEKCLLAGAGAASAGRSTGWRSTPRRSDGRPHASHRGRPGGLQ